MLTESRGEFSDLHSNFRLRALGYLSRIQIPTETSVTNCSHKHGLRLSCRHDVVMFTWGRIVLSLPRRARVDWNWPISREKYLKIDWSVKMPLHWCIVGVADT